MTKERMIDGWPADLIEEIEIGAQIGDMHYEWTKPDKGPKPPKGGSKPKTDSGTGKQVRKKHPPKR